MEVLVPANLTWWMGPETGTIPPKPVDDEDQSVAVDSAGVNDVRMMSNVQRPVAVDEVIPGVGTQSQAWEPNPE